MGPREQHHGDGEGLHGGGRNSQGPYISSVLETNDPFGQFFGAMNDDIVLPLDARIIENFRLSATMPSSSIPHGEVRWNAN
jgi:hypothetical protein